MISTHWVEKRRCSTYTDCVWFLSFLRCSGAGEPPPEERCPPRVWSAVWSQSWWETLTDLINMAYIKYNTKTNHHFFVNAFLDSWASHEGYYLVLSAQCKLTVELLNRHIDYILHFYWIFTLVKKAFDHTLGEKSCGCNCLIKPTEFTLEKGKTVKYKHAWALYSIFPAQNTNKVLL